MIRVRQSGRGIGQGVDLNVIPGSSLSVRQNGPFIELVIPSVAGGGQPAPANASFIVVGAHGGLTAERIISPVSPLVGTDNGAGSTYSVEISVASQARGDLFTRGSSAWGRLALATGGVLIGGATDPAWLAAGFAGQRLTVRAGAPAWEWSALVSPRRTLEAAAEYNSANWNMIGVAPSNLGTSQPLADSDGTWMGRRNSGGAGSAAGWYWANGYGRYDSTYRYRLRIKLDADLTNESFWCGVYNVAGSRPTEAAAYTDQHVMFRFVHGTDTNVQLSSADSGGTQSVSDTGLAPSASTAFYAELDFMTAGSVTARIYDSTGATLLGSVTKATNLPSAATIMGRCVMVVSQGAGTHDVYCSKIHLEAY